MLVDQTPIGRTPRSNPVTYIKAFDAIRELFASLPEAKQRGYAAGHFSFNVPGGRCDVCEGDGTVTVEMQFLADVELPCEECNGNPLQSQRPGNQYRGKNIHEVLNLTVKEALRFFAGQTRSWKSWPSWTRWAWATFAWANRRRRSQAGKRRGSSWRRIFPRAAARWGEPQTDGAAKAAAGCSTFSMSRPPDCILTM